MQLHISFTFKEDFHFFKIWFDYILINFFQRSQDGSREKKIGKE
jgi:hypothetical protein